MLILSSLSFASSTVELKPYVLTKLTSSKLSDSAQLAKEQLKAKGLNIVGEYSPYKDTLIVVVTNSDLVTLASKSKFGGYGAAQRVAITKTKGKVQVSYTNPLYMAQIYRMKDDLSSVRKLLGSALGDVKEFGTTEGFAPNELREYHYMMFMPYFDDHNELAKHKSYDAAVKAVEKGLSNPALGVKKVYRIDLPSKDETVIGVGINNKKEAGRDQTVMENCDTAELKHSAHLPYEILVSGNKVYALHGKFRIAQSFPDLTMGTFMQISGAPGSIEELLAKVAKGK